jgi:hypothetical protein
LEIGDGKREERKESEEKRESESFVCVFVGASEMPRMKILKTADLEF